MAVELKQELLTSLIASVIRVQKKYAHEMTGVRNERRDEIKAEINRLVAEKLEK
jgi:hypothetical protein